MPGTQELAILLKLKDDASKQLQGFNKQVDQTRQRLQALGKAAMVAGSAIMGTLIKSTLDWAKTGAEIHDLALRTGFATEALSELKYVAEQSGTSLNSMERAIRNMHQSLADAAEGTGLGAEAIAKLNLNVEELKAMKPEDAFWAMMEAIAELETQTDKVSVASDIFGARVGSELIPILADGKEAIIALKEEAHELGVVFDQEGADAAKALDDSITRLKTAVTGLRNELAESFAPVMGDWIQGLVDAVSWFTDLIDKFPGVKNVFMAFGMTGAIYAAMAAFFRLLLGINILSGPAGWAAAIAAASIVGIGGIVGEMHRKKAEAEAAELEKEEREKRRKEAEAANVRLEAEWKALGEERKELEARLERGEISKRMYEELLEGHLGRAGAVSREWEEVRATLAAIPELQHGGLVTRPTLAMIGERGPEAVIPLNKAAPLTVNVVVEGSIIQEHDLAQTIRRELLLIKDRNYTTGIA